jgi:hypothetical protein
VKHGPPDTVSSYSSEPASGSPLKHTKVQISAQA